jgi:translation initiation factor IF-2
MRKTIISLIGKVDHGKTHLLQNLGIKTVSENDGITTRCQFYNYLENILMVDTPGHDAIATDR